MRQSKFWHPMGELAPLYPVSREHFNTLSDATGIMQHAIGRRPDPAHGYCTDDVARALLVDLVHLPELGWQAVDVSVRRSLRFLVDAFDPALGRFRNCRGSDGRWLDSTRSQDAHARAILALGELIARAPQGTLRDVAIPLFERALPGASELNALRPRAAVLLGCDAAIRGGLGGETLRTYRMVANELRVSFDGRSLRSEWPWPEPVLTYENALPARALIIGGQRLGHVGMIRIGCRLLDWLIEAQTSPRGHLTPVGNHGWWRRDGARAQFDQQPIEATTLLLAAAAAYEATGEDRYRAVMEMAYGWFLGANDVAARVAEPERGACHDGVTSSGVNENQGAESTLMWLIALEEIRSLRQRISVQSTAATSSSAIASSR
jgi:hypothetical protein